MPVLYSSIGLWMYSNRQIYDNKVLPRASMNGIQDHSHTVVYTLTTFTPGTPFLIILIVALVNCIVMALELKLSKKLTFVSGNLNKEIKKMRRANLEHFYQNIKQDYYHKWYIKMQHYMNKTLGTLSVSQNMWNEFSKELKEIDNGKV